MAPNPKNSDAPTRIQIQTSTESILDELWGLADEAIRDFSLQDPSPLLLPDPIPVVKDDPISLLEQANALSKSGLSSEARGIRMKAMLLMQVMT